jgi:hypothetical protein
MSRIFGEVRQLGYVVEDIHAALEHWTRIMGVGPFYLLSDREVQNFTYNGAPYPMRLTGAVAFSGPLQIELIQQKNDSPSMFREFLEANGGGGLHHLGFWCDDADARCAKACEMGYIVGQSGEVVAGERFYYLRTEMHPGTVVEISEAGELKRQFFSFLQDEAARWDGSDPIRPLSL